MIATKKSKKRKDSSQAADKGGAVVVWWADLYQKEAFRQLSDTSLNERVDKDFTFIDQKIVKNTINDLIAKQELSATAKNFTITTPRTSFIYCLPKIHKPNNQIRPIVSTCSGPTELISSYLGLCTSVNYKPQTHIVTCCIYLSIHHTSSISCLSHSFSD